MKTQKNWRLGVGIVLVNDEKKVFAGSRNDVNRKMISFFLKKPWQMPQGGIEQGEEPTDAVLRELLEETGVNNVDIIGETSKWLEYRIPHSLKRRNSTIQGQRQKWFLIKFNGTDSDINLHFSNHAEFDSWRWMSPGNLVRLSVHFKRQLYVDVFKNFGWYFKDSTNHPAPTKK